MSRRTYLIRRIPGHHLIDGCRVIEQPNWRVTHGSNQGEAIVQLRQLGQIFCELDARDFGRNGFENTLYIIGHIFLGIP